jgi:hypothetical protein
MFGSVMQFLRYAYITRYEYFAEDYPKEVALSWAGRSIGACTLSIVAGIIMLAIAATGGIRGLPESVIVGLLVIFSFGGVLWFAAFVEHGEKLQLVIAEIQRESPEQKERRHNLTSRYAWGSLIFFGISFGAMIARAIHEHNAS